MGTPEISILMPFCNEYPQVAFTIRSIMEELSGRVGYEIIAINNYCDEVSQQKRPEDKGGKYVENLSKYIPELTYIHYKDKLSHWNAKRVGIEASKGKYLWFCDSHCMVGRNALFDMFTYYKKFHVELNGTIHLPLTYHILEQKWIIYKLVAELSQSSYHYAFTSYRDSEEPYEVPCMSTCGMLMTRELYDYVGGWPKELGIYGGGENFINFTLAVLGKKKWIFPGKALHHHADTRGYHWRHDDYAKNRLIATYLFAGEKAAYNSLNYMRGNRVIYKNMMISIKDNCGPQRALIKKRQKEEINEWIQKFLEKCE